MSLDDLCANYYATPISCNAKELDMHARDKNTPIEECVRVVDMLMTRHEDIARTCLVDVWKARWKEFMPTLQSRWVQMLPYGMRRDWFLHADTVDETIRLKALQPRDDDFTVQWLNDAKKRWAGKIILASRFLHNARVRAWLSSQLKDNTIDNALKGDVADIMTRHETTQSEAAMWFATTNQSHVTAIHNRAQNVHSVATKCALHMRECKRRAENATLLSFDQIKELLFAAAPQGESAQERMADVMHRVNNDNSYIYNVCTLKDLLKYVVHIAQSHNLVERLAEELIDQAYTCATGLATHMVNALSELDDFGALVSPFESYKTKFLYHLQNAISEHPRCDEMWEVWGTKQLRRLPGISAWMNETYEKIQKLLEEDDEDNAFFIECVRCMEECDYLRV